MPPLPLPCHHESCDKRAAGSSSSCGGHESVRASRTMKRVECVVCKRIFQVASTARASTCGQACKKERRQLRQGQWKIANAARVSAKGAERYDAKRDEILANAAKWRANNPDAIRVAKRHFKREREKRERLTRRHVTQRDLQRMLARHRGCAYCGNNSEPIHWDHVLPLARGGGTTKGNLLPACAPCNLSKGAKTVMEWRIRKLQIV